ncbi:hypothetical protein IKN40_04120 [bacterium]|nr:hypothetical protein [bacterium]
MASYNVDKTILVLPNNINTRIGAVRRTIHDLNMILRLDYKNRVNNRDEAEERFQN